MKRSTAQLSLAGMADTAGAVLSFDKNYRYVLTRGPTTTSRVLFCLHNPSYADALYDDPTTARCTGFSRSLTKAFAIVNPWAHRATDPDDLLHSLARGRDIVGPENDFHIRREACDARTTHIVIGWGIVHRRMQARVEEVVDILRESGLPLLCLGTNIDGSPRHPLYLASNTPLVPWRRPAR